MTKVLFLRGLPDSNELSATVFRGRMRFMILGCANVRQSLQRSNSELHTGEVLFFGKGSDVPLVRSEQPDVIFNEISDPDTHGASLARAEGFCGQWQVPVINHPALVRRLTRDYVWRTLGAGDGSSVDGLIVPKTVRCQLTAPEQVAEIASQEELSFPLLVRMAGEHGGRTLVRLDSPKDIAPLHALALDGSDFYLTEFVDFRSPDGLYRKQRFAVVAGKTFLRHHIIGDHWLVNAASDHFKREREDLLKEELVLMKSISEEPTPAIQPIIDAIHRATELEYFGIDASVNESGELVLFEVNANMNLLVNNPRPLEHHQQAVKVITHEVEQMILSQLT